MTGAAMVQWAGGQPRVRRRVVVDENSVGGIRQVRFEAVNTTPVARSTEAESEDGRRSADK